MTGLFDTHCHLTEPEFDADRDAVLARARAAGVEKIVAIGITADSSQSTVRLAQSQPQPSQPDVVASVGIHPNYCGQAAPGDWQRILDLAGQPGVVALGETGLDRHWDYTPFAIQQDYFDRHLRLSQARGLPFVVHSRECDGDVLAMLREARTRGPLQGVMHSFSGDDATAAECLDLGLVISFAGMVTFKKSAALRTVAAMIPADRILVETDSPYLAPHPFRGKRNEPAHLVLTARCLAEVRGQSFEEFTVHTSENANRLFGLSS